MKKILVISGGGLKGIIPAIVVNHIEQVEGKPCSAIYDLICGTSTGSVIGGALSSSVSGGALERLYCEQVPKLFTPRNRLNPLTWNKPEKYNKEPFIAAIRNETKNCTMMNLKTLLMTTAFNLCSGRTHFIHSDDSKEKLYPVSDVISWSGLSAALYFGKICVGDFRWKHNTPDGETINKYGAVFQDGGQGTQNDPVLFALIEGLRRWPNEYIHIVSIGCGETDNYLPYVKAKKTNIINQVVSYFGQARNEASALQVMGVEVLDLIFDKITFSRINTTISKKIDLLDGKKYIKEYIAIGNHLKSKYVVV